MNRAVFICCAIIALAAALAAALGAAQVHGAETGTITGSVDKPAAITAVAAVNRDLPDKKYSGTIDAKTGVFTIKDLPLRASYDVILDAGPARLEGVNLKVPRSDYEEEQPLTKEDVEVLKKAALSLNKFENKVEVLAVSGNIQHAAVLLHKLRTEGFINSQPGEVIWRLEVQCFERPDETWVKRQDELAVVHYRRRIQKTEYDKVALTLEPALGGVELTAKQPEVKLPKVAAPPADPGVRVHAQKDK
jgi:hypothetical protein